MIRIELGELYGMDSEKDLLQVIANLQNMGMSDLEIQDILDRSKAESEE